MAKEIELNICPDKEKCLQYVGISDRGRRDELFNASSSCKYQGGEGCPFREFVIREAHEYHGAGATD